MTYRGMSGWTGVGKHGTESALNALSDGYLCRLVREPLTVLTQPGSCKWIATAFVCNLNPCS